MQGNRITQGISCADVADVCLKALHNPEARNKTFEVGWGQQGEGPQGDPAWRDVAEVWGWVMWHHTLSLFPWVCFESELEEGLNPNPPPHPQPAWLYRHSFPSSTQVCFEYEPEEGLELYELISHLPGQHRGG